MSRKTPKQVSFNPDFNDEDNNNNNNNRPINFLRHGGGIKVAGNRKRFATVFNFRLSKASSSSSSSGFCPVRFLKRLGAKVARALGFVSTRRKKSSRKVCSSSLNRSRSYAESVIIDSHQAEAIEDCIEFLNSSSSSSSYFQRSSSVSSNSCY